MTGPQSYALARAAARALPGAADPAVARLLAALLRRLHPERERAACRNLAALHPAWSTVEVARAARAAHAAYGRFLLEYLRHAGRTDALERRVRFAEDVSFREAIEDRRGIVMCTAHIGNWEVGAMALAARGLPTMVVAGEQYASAWRDGVRSVKSEAGIRIVGPRESPRRLLRHLEAGGVVCLLVDGDVFDRGWPARVGGLEIPLPNGAARLAAVSGALLAGALCRRQGSGFRIEIESLGEDAAHRPREARRLHAAVAAWLERALLRHPAEWCVFRPFFPAERSVA